MPYLSNLRYEEEPSRQYLTDLFNSVQLKDIVKRNKIRDVDLLERIIAYMTANVGTIFSASSLARFFKNKQRTVAAETILNYVRYCCDASARICRASRYWPPMKSIILRITASVKLCLAGTRRTST